MTWKEFAASLVDSLAWPAGVVALGLLFRAKIKDLLTAGSLRRLKVPGVEAEWDEAADVVEDATATAAQEALPPVIPAAETERREKSPVPSAINGYKMQSTYRELLGFLELHLRERGYEAPQSASTTEHLAWGMSQGVLTKASATAIEGMGHLVALAQHRRVTEAEAKEFVTQVAAVMYAIRQDADRLQEPPGSSGVGTATETNVAGNIVPRGQSRRIGTATETNVAGNITPPGGSRGGHSGGAKEPELPRSDDEA